MDGNISIYPLHFGQDTFEATLSSPSHWKEKRERERDEMRVSIIWYIHMKDNKKQQQISLTRVYLAESLTQLGYYIIAYLTKKIASQATAAARIVYMLERAGDNNSNGF